jgi:hypothetical protein
VAAPAWLRPMWCATSRSCSWPLEQVARDRHDETTA